MLARALIRYTLRDATSLDLLPSHIAAVSLIIAINIGLSQLSQKIGLSVDNMVPNLQRLRRGGTFHECDLWNPDYKAATQIEQTKPL